MRERWIVERTRDHLWIGTPKPDAVGGERVDEVVVGICISGMTQQALDRAIADAELIASAHTLRAKLAEKDKELERERARTVETLLAWRGIDPGDECASCGGSGAKAYASTSTWRGGIGGSMICGDVCDVCWGSGSRTVTWADLRKIRRAIAEEG